MACVVYRNIVGNVNMKMENKGPLKNARTISGETKCREVYNREYKGSGQRYRRTAYSRTEENGEVCVV
jgi:hypothetical protein